MFHDTVSREETVVIDERLLVALHDGGVRLAESQERLIQHWGKHLLEDWRSLELLAQRQGTGERAEGD